MIYTLADHKRLWPSLTLAQRQRLGVEPTGRPLDDDGIEGPRTRSGLYIAPDQDHALVMAAFKMALIGAREDGGNNCGYFPHIFMGFLDYDPSADHAPYRGKRQGLWCAGFASWVIRAVYGERAPRSWGARELTRKWATGGRRIPLVTLAEAGDVICWRREEPGEPAAGHVGIVVGRTDELLLVVEGNGTRRQGAVGIYGYSLAKRAKRGTEAPQDVLMIARRQAP